MVALQGPLWTLTSNSMATMSSNIVHASSEGRMHSVFCWGMCLGASSR